MDGEGWEEEEAIVRARVGGGVESEMGNQRRRGGSGRRGEEREGIWRKQNKKVYYAYISVGCHGACQIMVKDLFAYLEQLMVANFCKDLFVYL
jgi:hypothetical protein